MNPSILLRLSSKLFDSLLLEMQAASIVFKALLKRGNV
jgi:hypothetical protein